MTFKLIWNSNTRNYWKLICSIDLMAKLLLITSDWRDFLTNGNDLKKTLNLNDSCEKACSITFSAKRWLRLGDLRTICNLEIVMVEKGRS